jgi:hypothetical protein
MHRDQWGLIVQADGDGGDTCQRTGMFYFAKFLQLDILLPPWWWKDDFLAAALHMDADGTIFRHPYQPKHNDPKNVSRDQSDPYIIALSSYCPDAIKFKQIWSRFKSRWLCYQNSDVPQLQSISMWIRALRVWWLWPVLLLTDLGFFLTLLGIWWKGRDPDHSDDNNHIIRLAQAQRFLPTPVSWFARKLYKLTRARCYGAEGVEHWSKPHSYKYNETSPIMAALVWYHCAEHGGNPEIAEAWRPVVERF